MDVGDVLRDRVHEANGFERMVAVSLLAHGALLAAILLSPVGWLGSKPAPRTVMTISLSGGNGGPNNGGLTSIGGRTVQAEPLPQTARREAVRAPAAKTPEQTVPIPSKR